MLGKILANIFLPILLFSSGEAIDDNVLTSDGDTQSFFVLSFPPSYPSCFTEGTTWSTEEAVDIVEGTPSLYSCQDLCFQSPNCQQFTWYDAQAISLAWTCFLYSFTTTEIPCSNCVSGDILKPQKHGDWFCPPSNEPSTCHLDCHPGYVSNNGTVISCSMESGPRLSVALITGKAVSPMNSVEVYSEGLHQTLPNLPYRDPRMYHSLDLVDHSSVSALGQLHLLGGADSSSESTSEYLARSSTSWSEDWQLLEANHGACAAKVGPEVAIITGGYSQKSSVISYNVTSGAATRLQNLISPRYFHGCCYVRDEGFRGVLVAGGNEGVSDYEFSQIYDIKTGEWSTTGTLSTARGGGVRMFVIGEQILLSGGFWNGALSTMDRFNLTSRTWKAAQNMLEARPYHAVTVVPPSVVGVGPH